MSTAGAQAGLELFESLNIEYEKAYHNNSFKIVCIQKAISLLPRGARVLDVGCGTGTPVSSMLSEAGLDLTGIDIAPKMIELCRSRISSGSFVVSDMLKYEPKGTFDAVFIIFSHLSLSYADFHGAVYRYAQTLRPDGGIFVIGQMPCDTYISMDSAAYDETHSYVEDYDAPFMGKSEPTLMMNEQGQLEFLKSMGFEIISNSVDLFQPENEWCVPEWQQYIIARRVSDQPVPQPRPLPMRKAYAVIHRYRDAVENRRERT